MAGTRLPDVTKAKWLGRTSAVATLIFAALMVTSPSAGAQHAPGGVTIFEDPGCTGVNDLLDAKVTVPFSIQVTGLTPFSTTSQFFVTDKDAHPEIVYGPITILNVNEFGRACGEVLSAPPGLWKIDVVEEGSGFTDSKVFTIEGPPASPTTTTTTPPIPEPNPTTTTTTPPTTSTLPPTTTTSATTSTTTTVSPTTTTSTTTASLPTTTAPAQTTTTATPAALVVRRPGSELPWTIVFAKTLERELPATATLAETGADLGWAIALGCGLLVVGLTLVRSRRHR